MQYKKIHPGSQNLEALDRDFSEVILGLSSLYHTILPLSLKSLNFEQHGNIYVTICKIGSGNLLRDAGSSVLCSVTP